MGTGLNKSLALLIWKVTVLVYFFSPSLLKSSTLSTYFPLSTKKKRKTLSAFGSLSSLDLAVDGGRSALGESKIQRDIYAFLLYERGVIRVFRLKRWRIWLGFGNFWNLILFMCTFRSLSPTYLPPGFAYQNGRFSFFLFSFFSFSGNGRPVLVYQSDQPVRPDPTNPTNIRSEPDRSFGRSRVQFPKSDHWSGRVKSDPNPKNPTDVQP